MPSKTTTVSSGSVSRRHNTTGVSQGAGGCKRFYVGTISGNLYRSYMKFNDLTYNASWWSGVGKITSATLTLTVDDGLGVLGATMNTGSPKVLLAALTAAFTEGTNSASFVTADYTRPAFSASRQRIERPTRGYTETVSFDVTDWLEDWAPTTVKRRDGGNGRQVANHGFQLSGYADTTQDWAVFSEDESVLTAYRPLLTLNYEYGPTVPNTPTNLTPTGAGVAVASFQGDFADIDVTDKLARSHVQVFAANAIRSGTAAITDVITVAAHGFTVGTEVWFTSLTGGAGLSLAQPYWVKTAPSSSTFTVSASPGGLAVNITTLYTALSVGRAIYSLEKAEGNAAILAARFDHVPDNLTLTKGTTYQWRARVKDHEGSTSLWTALTSFSITNTNPTAPTLAPANASSYSSLANVNFTGTFADADVGDTLLAYQVQMSAYAEGDARWLDDEFILWNTGKVYGTFPEAKFLTEYGGASLASGTYYWRARVWDNNHGVSNWTYSSIVVTADFVQEPNETTSAIQLRPRAPWRIVIRDMLQSDGVTATVGRGPGRTVAIIEDAMNTGASLMYNSPGEAHWTMPVNHPQISVIEPKQTHYSIQFRHGDGWRETYAGLVWNIDASDRDVIFYGLDYLALLDRQVDTRYDAANAERDYLSGGSKYTSQTIRTIVMDQLNYYKARANSPIGFITLGTIDAMNETVTVYSTYQPGLNFITGLLESHRAGKALNTRLSVQRTTSGGYQWVVQDNPGTLRENLRLRYGEMVQGYRVQPFGENWATRVDALGRDKDGLKVRYTSQQAAGISEATWGRWDFPTFIDGISDGTDLERRARQMVTNLSKLGQRMGLGLRSGVLQPRDGYDLMDRFPIEIEHGSIDTGQYGHDGEWVCVGITWQALQRGDLNTTLTLVPKESGSEPSADLLVTAPISTQAEWQVGWKAPNPLTATARYWLDQSTGTVYSRAAGAVIVDGVTGTV